MEIKWEMWEALDPLTASVRRPTRCCWVAVWSGGEQLTGQGSQPLSIQTSPPPATNCQRLCHQLPAGAGTFRPCSTITWVHLTRGFCTQCKLTSFCALEMSWWAAWLGVNRDHLWENWLRGPTGRWRCDGNKKEGGRRRSRSRSSSSAAGRRHGTRFKKISEPRSHCRAQRRLKQSSVVRRCFQP